MVELNNGFSQKEKIIYFWILFIYSYFLVCTVSILFDPIIGTLVPVIKCVIKYNNNN